MWNNIITIVEGIVVTAFFVWIVIKYIDNNNDDDDDGSSISTTNYRFYEGLSY